MTDRMECLLDDCLRVHLKEIRKICKDKTNNQVMCKSNITAVDFDKISRKYCKKKGVPSFPCTVDAMYISMNGQWYLIEFKNGDINQLQVHRKIYDSLIMLLELEIMKDFQFARNNITYILVYNSKKYGIDTERLDLESGSLKKVYDYTLKRAEEERKLFGLYKLENYLLKEVHTYTEMEFHDKFIGPMEIEEQIYNVGRMDDKNAD